MITFYILIFITFASPTSQSITEWGDYGNYRTLSACTSYQQHLLETLPETTYTACYGVNLSEERFYDGNE